MDFSAQIGDSYNQPGYWDPAALRWVDGIRPLGFPRTVVSGHPPPRIFMRLRAA